MFVKNEKSINTRAITVYNTIFAITVLLSIVAFVIICLNTFKNANSNLTDLFIITIILLFISSIFIYFYRKLLLSYLKILEQFNVFEDAFKDVNNIEQFKNKYSSIGNKISKINYISDIWWEFCETLIIKREKECNVDVHSYDVKDNPIVTLKNTAQVELYVNENNFINIQTNSAFLDSIPGILTGIGLFGTFLAIAIALFGFKIGNTLETTTSIQNLLGGLSVKFISSIAGILSSILFLYITNDLFSKMKGKLNKLQIKLNKILPRRTTESYLCDVLEETLEQKQLLYKISEATIKHNEHLSEVNEVIEDQSNSLKHFLTDMNFMDAIKNAVSESLSGAKPDLIDAINISVEKLEEIKNAIFEKLETIKAEMINTLNNLNTSIASSIAGSMNNSLEVLNNNLGSAIASLTESMETFKTLKQQSSADIMEKMIFELKQCMTDMREEFHKQILDGSGDTINSLQDNLKNASNYLSGVQETFSGFMEKLLLQQEKENQIRNDAVSQAVTSTVQQVSDVNKNIQQNIENQNIQLNEWLNIIKKYIDEIHYNEKNVKENYSEVLKELNTVINRQSATINDLTLVSNKIVTSSNNLEKSSSLVANITEKTGIAANNITQSISASNKLVEQLNSAVNTNKESLTNIQTVVIKLNNELSHHISQFADKSHEFQEQMFTDFTRHLNDVIHNLSVAVEEQKEIMEDLSEQLDRINR